MPSLSRTRVELHQAALELADMDQPGTGPAFIDTTEGYARVNDSIAKLWDVLVDAEADEQLALVEEFTATGSSVDLSASALGLTYAVYKILALDVRYSGRWSAVRRASRADRNDWQDTGVPRPLFFRVLGASLGADGPSLRLLPEVTGSHDYRLEYIPQPPELDDDADELALPNRLWQWVSYDLAVSYLVKAERDPSGLMAERDRLEAAFRKTSDVAPGQPRLVQDVRGRFGADPRLSRDWATFGRSR